MMRTFDEINRDARAQPAFSNGTEGYGWMANNCDRCVNDKSARDASVKPDPVNKGLVGCPVIAVAMLDKTPIEFLETAERDFQCIEFRDENDGPGPEPQPIPDPPGMDELIPRDDYTAPLMFSANVPRPAEVR